MSWLEFAANIIDNVFSWPVAVFLIVLLLRKQISELLRTVENFGLEAGGTKVSFTRSLERARESAEAAAGAASIRRRVAPRDRALLLEDHALIRELAREDPSDAIEAAWDSLIARQVWRLVRARDLPPDDTMSQLNRLHFLGVVPDYSIVDSVENLSAVRSEVRTTRSEPSPEEALEFERIALQVGFYLSGLLHSDTEPQPPQ